MNKLITYLLVSFYCLLTISKSMAQSPGGVNGFAAWYKGDMGLTSSSWLDQSNNGYNLTRGASIENSSMMNFNSVASFNNQTTNTYSSVSTAKPNWPTGITANTYYYVAKNSTDVNDFNVFGIGTNGVNTGFHSGQIGVVGRIASSGSTPLITGSATATVTSPPNWDARGINSGINLVRTGYDGGGATGRNYISAQGGTETTNTSNVTPTYTNASIFRIGASGANTVPWIGDIAEIIVFPTKHDVATANKIESYLSIKYGITLGTNTTPRNYTSSAGAIIWTGNSTYQNNIAGIARDNTSALHQKQSRSINSGEQVIIATTGVANTNANNTVGLVDGQFLIWGDNGGSKSLSTLISGIPGVSHRFNAIWRIQNTGNVGVVRIMWPQGIQNIKLIQSTDTNFDATDIITDMHTNSIIINGMIYNYADVSFTNGHYFTFSGLATAPGGVFNGLQLWLRADKSTNSSIDGDQISYWGDQSLGARNAQQVRTSLNPTFASNNYNFNPTIVFNNGTTATVSPESSIINATGKVLITPSNNTINFNNSTFYVSGIKYNLTNWALMSFITRNNNGGSMNGLSNRTISLNGSNNPGWEISGATIQRRKNGEGTFPLGGEPNVFNIYRQSGTLNVFDYIGIGWGTNSFRNLSGEIGDLIIYSGLLTNQERQRIESYQAIKYGITLDQTVLTNYLNSNGAIIWNATTNSGYNNNIAGIGRDDASSLNQKQSKSINNGEQVLIATNGVANTNALNSKGLTDKQFLIWGDNNKERKLSTFLPIEINGILLSHIFDAIWKVQNTNSIDSVRVMWPVGITNLHLVQSTDATFNTSDIFTPMSRTISISGQDYNYVDVILTNGEYFTFAGFQIAPGGVLNGLKFWHRSDKGLSNIGTSITGWDDVSPNKLNISQMNTGLTPSYGAPTSTSNFYPFANFTNNQVLGQRVNSSLSTNTFEVFTSLDIGTTSGIYFGIGRNNTSNTSDNWDSPHQWADGTYTHTAIGGGAGSTSNPNPLNNSISQPIINHSRYNLSSHNKSINGSIMGPIASLGTTNNTPWFRGGHYIGGNNVTNSGMGGNDVGFRGKIFEILLFEKILTELERQKVNSYLALRSGITLRNNLPSGGIHSGTYNYISSKGSIVWNGSINPLFHNNIFGLGKDVYSGLSQMISTSANNIINGQLIASTTNNFILSNLDSNRIELDSTDNYVIFGDNNNTNTTLTVVNPISCPALADGIKRISKTWLVQETGSVGSIFLEINLSGYALASDIQLYVANNENLTSNSYVVPALSFSGGKAVFLVDFKDNAVQYFTVVGKEGAPTCNVCRGGKYIVRQGNSWNTSTKRINDSTGWFTYATDGEGTNLQARTNVTYNTASDEWVDAWYPSPYGSSALMPHRGVSNGTSSLRTYTTVLNRAGKVNFNLSGISEWYGNKVKVVVKGFCGATQINPIITPMTNSVWNGYTISGNTVLGNKYYRGLDIYSQVKVNFNRPVERIVVEYTIERNPVRNVHFWFTIGDMSVECESPLEPNKNNVFIKQSFDNDNIAACNEAELKFNIINKNCNGRTLSILRNDLPSGLEYVPNSYLGPGSPTYSGQSFLLENLNMSSGDTNLFVKVRSTNPGTIIAPTQFNTQSKYVVSIASGGVGDTILSDNLSALSGLQETTLTLTPKVATIMPELEFTSDNGQDACDTIGYTITIVNNTGATRTGLQLQPFLNLGQIINGSVTLSSGLIGTVIPDPQNNETTFFIPSLSVPVGTHTITFSTITTKIDEFAKNYIELFYDPTSNECALANKKVANLNRKCPTCEDGKGLFKMNSAWNNGGASARNSNQILNILVGSPASGTIKAEAIVTYPLSGGQSIEWFPSSFPRMNGKWTEISRNDNLNGASGKVFYEVKLKDNIGSLIAARPSFQVAGMTKISGQEDVVSIRGYCGLDEFKPKLRYAYNSTPANNAYYRRFVIDSANASAKGIAPYYDNTDWASMNIEFEKPVDRFIIEWSVNRSPIYKTQSNLYIGNVEFICDNKPEPNPDDVHVFSSIVGADTLPHCQEGIIKLNIKNWNCDPRTINLTSTLPAGIQFVDSSYNGIGSETPTMSGQNFSLSNLSVPSGNSYLYMKVKSINNTTASYATNFKYTVQGGTNIPNPYQSDDNSSLEGFQDLVINFESSPIIEKPTLVLKTDKECYEKGDTILYTMIFNNSSSSSLTNVEIVERMDNVKFLERVNATTFGGAILSEDSLGFYISDAVIPVGKDSILYKAVVLDTVKYIENLFEITIDPVSPCGNVNNSMSNLHKIDTAFYNPQTSGPTKPTFVGYTGGDRSLLIQNGWPQQVPNGWFTIQSKTKGFVITRGKSSDISTPVEGMILYDIDDKCIKLYNGTIWKCIQRQCKP